MTPSRRSIYRYLTFAAALSATTAAFTPSVVAADMPVKAQTVPVAEPSWTGFYIGVHGGWGWGDTRITDDSFNPTFRTTDLTSSGPIAGAQLGANWQSGNVVAGLEIDGSAASLRSSTANSGNQGIIAFTSQTIKIRALATGTARLGYAMGPWLAYAKGGAAWADMQLNTQFMVEPTVYDRSRFGWTAGAGIEVAFLRNVSARLEYDFIYFSRDHLVWNQQDSVANLDHFVHLVKAGINVRLGGDDVSAR
jgi:opacity protein-like surface antigen